MRKDDVPGHLHEPTCMELYLFAVAARYAAIARSYSSRMAMSLSSWNLNSAGARSLVCLHLREERAGRHVADGGHHLKLGRTFVDVGDAGIAVNPFDGIVLHVARTAVYLYGLVGKLVGIFTGEHLAERREGIGELVIGLHLALFLGRQRTFLAYLRPALVYLDETAVSYSIARDAYSFAFMFVRIS